MCWVEKCRDDDSSRETTENSSLFLHVIIFQTRQSPNILQPFSLAPQTVPRPLSISKRNKKMSGK